jgi:hypothetical protein
MKTRKTLALAAAILVLGVPVATAAPDGYQPDALDRYLANNGPDGFQPQLHANAQPDAVDRYVANALRQADLPDPTAASVPVDRAGGGGTSWRAGALGMLGGASIVLLAFAGASALRGRRRLVLR